MKRIAFVLPLLAAIACSTTGPCRSNTDCPGSNICSVDTQPDGPVVNGQCIYRCMVDRDCPSAQVCNLVLLNCGCQDAPGLLPDSGPIGDGGMIGTCSGLTGH